MWSKKFWTFEIPKTFLNAKKQPLRNNECISVFYNKQCIYNPQMTEWKPYTCKQWKSSKSISNDENITNWWFITINNWDRFPLSVMDKYNSETWLHPTQKPVALIEYLVKTYTNEWETVLDFTIWSWTTAVACLNTNRNFIWFELDKWYREIANKRLENRK
jgi:site-specific DNA-methyltransferase (adenine-specific)